MRDRERAERNVLFYGAANCEVYVSQVVCEWDTIMWHWWKMVVVCVQAIKARGSPTRPHRINPANYARFQSTGRLCWPQSRSGFFVEEILIFLSEIEPQWPGSCFRWSGNQIEWGLLTVIKTVLYTWWLSRQLTTVSERLGHNTVSLLPSRVFLCCCD